MMGAIFYWSGVWLWLCIGALVVCVLYKLTRHAIATAIFVRRMIRVCGWKETGTPLVRARVRIKLFVHYFRNPVDSVTARTGERAYWPGSEPGYECGE